MSDDPLQVYRDWVNRRSRDDRWLGALTDPSRHASLSNPLCGDRIVVRLRCDAERITAVRAEVRGCAICKASASLLGEHLEGRSIEAARSETGRALERMRGADPPLAADPLAADPQADDPLAELFGIRALRSRIRCATLPWEAVLDALD